MSMRAVDLTGGPVSIEGAVGLRHGKGYVRPWRLPPDDIELHHPMLAFMASMPAGVRLRFGTDASVISLDVDHVRIEPPLPDSPRPRYDLTIDGELVATRAAVEDQTTVVFEDVPAGDKVVEVWLPMTPGVRLRGLAVDDGAEVRPAPDDRRRWVTYGSSITHCGEAHSPARTWPATAARALDVHLTCLGFAGMCHLDPLVARVIADLPADRITLKLGINVHNMASLKERTFAPAVHGFLATIRDRHPETPITVISPILSPEREDSADSLVVMPTETFTLRGDLTLRQMREILESVVDVRRRRGDLALDYLDGRELFGEADLDHLPDGLHPDGDGYELIGNRFARWEAARA